MTAILTYRNRAITHDDIAFIRQVIADQYSAGRTAISRLIRDAWNGRQANGNPLTPHFRKRLCRHE